MINVIIDRYGFDGMTMVACYNGKEIPFSYRIGRHLDRDVYTREDWDKFEKFVKTMGEN